MRPEDCCGWAGETTPECLEFEVGATVETPFSGEWTRHKVVERYKTRVHQSKVAYVVSPPVPKSSLKKIDAAWFRKVVEGV